MSKSGVLIIVVGGNISQLLTSHEGQDSKPEPATVVRLREFLIHGESNTSILLHEGSSNNTKGLQIRVDIERLRSSDPASTEQEDSSQVKPDIWSKLVQKIKDNVDKYEGFVVLHGLDTLAYTASAVSFMIRNLNFPIVFTGSQRPLNYTRSDAPQNIYTALTIAAAKSLNIKPPINEVTIYLHDTLYRANRSSMASASSYRSFDSLTFPSLATIGEHIDVRGNLLNGASDKGTISWNIKSDRNIQIIDVFPGMQASVIESLVETDLDKLYIENLKKVALKLEEDNGETPEESDDYKLLIKLESILDNQKQSQRIVSLLNGNPENALEIIDNLDSKLLKEDTKVRGVVLRTYGMGTAPTSREVLKALKKLVDNGIIVMNVTQAHSSRVSFNSDPVSLRLFEQGVISGLDMTSEAAFAKMVVVLSDEKNSKKGIDHCEDELQKDLAGEQSHSVINFHFQSGSTDKENNNWCYNQIEFKAKDRKDFELDADLFNKIENIQLRILGLCKTQRGGSTKVIIVRTDEESVPSDFKKHTNKILDKDLEIENPNEDKSNTVNVSFDITDMKAKLFSKNAVFYIGSQLNISWSRISIVVYC